MTNRYLVPAPELVTLFQDQANIDYHLLALALGRRLLEGKYADTSAEVRVLTCQLKRGNIDDLATLALLSIAMSVINQGAASRFHVIQDALKHMALGDDQLLTNISQLLQEIDITKLSMTTDPNDDYSDANMRILLGTGCLISVTGAGNLAPLVLLFGAGGIPEEDFIFLLQHIRVTEAPTLQLDLQADALGINSIFNEMVNNLTSRVVEGDRKNEYQITELLLLYCPQVIVWNKLWDCWAKPSQMSMLEMLALFRPVAAYQPTEADLACATGICRALIQSKEIDWNAMSVYLPSFLPKELIDELRDYHTFRSNTKTQFRQMLESLKETGAKVRLTAGGMGEQIYLLHLSMSAQWGALEAETVYARMGHRLKDYLNIWSVEQMDRIQEYVNWQ